MTSDSRSHRLSAGRAGAAWQWIVAHASTLWGFALLAVVLALSWHALRAIHTRDVRAALHSLDADWLTIAGILTIGSIAVMGLYDVLAFRQTRTRPIERWRFGAVAFAWSNFLTLGPLAGPAIRLWLYRTRVDDISELQTGIVSVVIAFTSGLAGWTIAGLFTAWTGGGTIAVALEALAFAVVAAWAGRAIARRTDRFGGPAASATRTIELALVGWTDWLLAAATFVACIRATNAGAPLLRVVDTFFYGQVIGLVSLIPGGFGSSDAFWIARLPINQSISTAALTAYRFIYYIAPWFTASLVLLSWATRQSSRRIDVARRIIASLVGGAGLLIVLSSASPALHARLLLLEQHVPLPVVEAGQLTAALAGLLLLVLARGLARGYRAAYQATLALLLLAGFASILKGLDWEETIALGTVAIAAWSQAGLFDRASSGDWLEWADLGLGFAALLLFLLFGTFSHHLSSAALERWTAMGYHLQSARFLRSAASMVLAVAVGGLYVMLRTPVRFTPPGDEVIAGTLQAHAAYGRGTTPMMVAVGDKSVFFFADRGFCLYRTIGPYLAVFSDPMVRSAADRNAFVDALFAFAAELDRRPLFYQISVDWIPLLHDRGYHLFKLGEEAHVRLDRVTTEGHAGKMTRQILRRAERDGLAFRIAETADVDARMGELEEISAEWLAAKQVVERQFSIGYFDPAYIRRCRCALVEEAGADGRIVGFANLLEDPHREELSIDLMRYRTGGPSVMDFLITSLLLHGKREGYRTFNLGMAPLASVGAQRGAHGRERLAGLFFRRGEAWYNFQGVRFYKQKFDPDWVPRYLAYQRAGEWPIALANVSALIAGSWGSALRPGRDAPGQTREGRLATVGHA
ncbi:MAG: bifunctional lysylphosphatidylglycerol flippase/synthetase MprF [Acidobacteria bacterium]|nr:bifunctional lysylphosphatidylglycerol flippase/synthetase MprF [Acidobacteriota bacterium]